MVALVKEQLPESLEMQAARCTHLAGTAVLLCQYQVLTILEMVEMAEKT